MTLSTIKKIRLSSAHAGQHDADWAAERAAIIQHLAKNEFEVVDGSVDATIRLSGHDGAEEHVKKSQGYIFFGYPTIGEMFKLCSLFVGTQTLDANLHISEGGQLYRKPIILYGDPAFHNKFLKQVVRLRDAGTIEQEIFEPNGILRFPQTIEEISGAINREILAKSSIHGKGMELAHSEFSELGKFRPRELEAPEYKVCVFTSASKKQDEVSMVEARQLGTLITKNGWGLISGLGSVGLMREVHVGCVENGGWSAGSNCPHIIAQEGMPEGFAEAWVIPDIYQRMEVMLRPADIVVISGGGRGGAGTLQETLACYLLIARKARLMISKDHYHKPLIIDNRNELWNAAIDIAKDYGLVEDKHFHVVKGTEQVVDTIKRIRSGAIKRVAAH